MGKAKRARKPNEIFNTPNSFGVHMFRCSLVFAVFMRPLNFNFLYFFVHAVSGVPSVLKTPKNLKSFFLFTRSSGVPSVPKTGKNPICFFLVHAVFGCW